jgi:uncharacterized protein YigA (DUF484 family)
MTDHTDLKKIDAAVLEDQLVYQYLLEHPAFFQQHPELLARLRLPHAQRGAVSLVERQLEMQRERIRGLEEDITRLMSIARANEHIFFALNQLHLDLLAARQKTDIRLALSAFANKMPQVHACNLIEFSHEAMGQQFSSLQLVLQNRLQGRHYYFGRLNREEMATLFPPHIHSVALLQISAADEPIALLAFGSQLDDHFQPSMDTLFLDHIAKLLALVLPRDGQRPG